VKKSERVSQQTEWREEGSNGILAVPVFSREISPLSLRGKVNDGRALLLLLAAGGSPRARVSGAPLSSTEIDGFDGFDEVRLGMTN
jgi:hypothetical protein